MAEQHLEYPLCKIFFKKLSKSISRAHQQHAKRKSVPETLTASGIVSRPRPSFNPGNYLSSASNRVGRNIRQDSSGNHSSSFTPSRTIKTAGGTSRYATNHTDLTQSIFSPRQQSVRKSPSKMTSRGGLALVKTSDSGITGRRRIIVAVNNNYTGN